MLAQKSAFYSLVNLLKNPIFIFGWFGLATLSYVYVDIPVAFYFHNLEIPTLHTAAKSLSMLGLGGTYIFGFAVLYLFARFYSKNADFIHKAYFLFLSAVIPALICDALKVSLGRSRPSQLFQHQEYGFYFWQTHANMWSFPSGHAMEISAVMMALSFVFPRYWWGFLSILLLTSLSRLILTAHYVSDVMVGMFLGAISVIILHRILQKYRSASLAINRVNAL